MKPSFDNELDESLRGLDNSFRLKPTYKEQLRQKVIHPQQIKVFNKRLWVSIAAAAVIFVTVGTSPLYSPTMAALAAKIIPLEIKKNPTSGPEAVMDEIRQIVKDSGYEQGSIGITADFTIELLLIEGNENISAMKKVIEPRIEQMLSNKGIDQYQLKISASAEELVTAPDEENRRMDDNILTIVEEAFTAYGHPGVSHKYGISYGSLPDKSYTVGLSMPDTIKEGEMIKEYIVEKLAKENIKVSKVEITYFSIEEKEFDDRWREIGKDIYSALAGKSIYNVKGFSYSVRDGKAHIDIRTTFTTKPSEAVSKEIMEAVNHYLETEEVKNEIKDDPYEINFLRKDERVLFKIENNK